MSWRWGAANARTLAYREIINSHTCSPQAAVREEGDVFLDGVQVWSSSPASVIKPWERLTTELRRSPLTPRWSCQDGLSVTAIDQAQPGAPRVTSNIFIARILPLNGNLSGIMQWACASGYIFTSCWQRRSLTSFRSFCCVCLDMHRNDFLDQHQHQILNHCSNPDFIATCVH